MKDNNNDKVKNNRLKDRLKIEEVHFHSGEVVRIFFNTGLILLTNEVGLKAIEKMIYG